MDKVCLDTLNSMEREDFVDLLGEIYENSPWVAREVFSRRPFRNIEDLHSAMQGVVNNADRGTKLELLREHPDLGEQTEMTEASQKEQESAGLNDLSRKEYETFQRLNRNYRDKFDFPFIMAVKNESVSTIRNAMEDRIDKSPEDEFETALANVHQIARFRLNDLITSS